MRMGGSLWRSIYARRNCPPGGSGRHQQRVAQRDPFLFCFWYITNLGRTRLHRNHPTVEVHLSVAGRRGPLAHQHFHTNSFERIEWCVSKKESQTRRELRRERTKVARWSSFESGSMYTECMNIPGCTAPTDDWNSRRPDESYESPVGGVAHRHAAQQFQGKRTKTMPNYEGSGLGERQYILCGTCEGTNGRK